MVYYIEYQKGDTAPALIDIDECKALLAEYGEEYMI